MSPKDLFRLEGKVAIIPGGSGGIGSTLAAGVCEAGASVTIVDRDGDELTRTCSRMREAGSEPLAMPPISPRRKPPTGQLPKQWTISAGEGKSSTSPPFADNSA